MSRSPSPLLLALLAGCRFAPDLSAYPPCDPEECPSGYECVAEEHVCVPSCSPESPCAVDAGRADAASSPADAGRPDASAPDAGPLRIVTSSLPEAREGTLYLQVLQATGGLRPYTFSVASGGLPAGLALTAQGTLSGTPGVAGTSSFVLQVTDATSQVAAQAYALPVSPATGTALTIQTATLPDGRVSTAYSAALVASGGSAPYAWSVASGTLPSGLSLSKEGVVSGSPLASGETSLELAVRDSSSTPQGALRPYTLRINPASGVALAITTTALADGAAGTYYLAQLAASGGTPPYSWSLSGGSALPSGLTLSSGGSIAGTPKSAGSISFSVQVTDAGAPAQSSSRSLTLSIAGGTTPPLSLTTATLPEGTVGKAYAATVTASGGLAPVSFSVSPGSSLPGGLTLSASGALGGTPTSAGTFSVSLSATDSSSPVQTATRSYVLGIGTGTATTPLSISTGSLPGTTVGATYTQALLAEGGTAPYTWSLASGALPPGLTLNSGGLVSGAPTAPGGFSFTARVTDSAAAQQVASRSFSVNVQPATLRLDTTTLPTASVGVSYRAQITSSGGTPPYTYSMLTGNLPSGLVLCASDAACARAGEITGVPKGKSHNQFEVQVSDSSIPVQTASRQFVLDVN